MSGKERRMFGPAGEQLLPATGTQRIIFPDRLALLLMTLLLASCDYEQRATGIVLDKDSKQPLTDVRIIKGHKEGAPEDKYLKYRSDGSGKFLVRYQSVSLFFGTPLRLSFSKPGFQTSKVRLDGRTENDTVYLEKLKR